MDNPAVISAALRGKPKFRPMHLLLTVGHGKEGGGRIHDIVRPGGADCWMIEYSFAGRVRVDWEGGGRSFGPKTVLCFPPGLEHNYRMEEHWDHYWITFQPRSGWDELLSWPRTNGGVMFLEADEELDHKIKGIFEEMIELKRGLISRKTDLIANLLENLLLHLDSTNPLVERQKIDPRIRGALEFMRQHYGEVISIPQMARLVNLSESRFCHLFKNHMHRTPMQYLERFRVQRGCEMLQMGSEPIASIALRCGYADPLYFSRIFKKHMEVSPRDFRRG
jgi:AraC family transcriptional regulator of arabinose operon